jgi:glycosyltransferase involved in cell wall biosynthesis
MRIIIILEYFYTSLMPVGGAERQAAKLARRLTERGIDVTIVTGQWKFGERKETVVDHVPVHRHFTFWRMFSIRGLKRFGHYTYLMTLFAYLIKNRNNYDLIHCHSAMSNAFVVALAGKLLNKKMIVRPMASGVQWGDISRMRNMRSLRWMLGKLKNFDRVIALNQGVVRELEEIGVEASKVVTLPNGVETDSIQHKTDYLAVSEITLTFVGRLHPQKGIETLLSALKKVKVRSPQIDWRLQLVGEGPLRPYLEAKARGLNIDDQVEFLGQVPDVFPILYASDIFVLPSRAEGMSNALLEAMTCGLPCIVSNIPANAEVIEDGQNGLLVNVNDDEDLAKAIIRLAQDQGLREELGRKAAQTIIEHYSIESVAKRYIALYRSLLQGPPERWVSSLAE